jgi:hypothetical protein
MAISKAVVKKTVAEKPQKPTVGIAGRTIDNSDDS